MTCLKMNMEQMENESNEGNKKHKSIWKWSAVNQNGIN
jgi:hypothetical protein